MILGKMQTRWEHILKQMESKSKSQKQFKVYSFMNIYVLYVLYI